MRLLVLATALGVLALAPTPGGARLAAERGVIASEGAGGSRAIVVAEGTTRRPRRLRMRVSSRPLQRVSGQWLVTCRPRSGRRRSARGTFAGRTTLRRTLRIPVASPRRCRVSATAQLSSRGRIRITLLRR